MWLNREEPRGQLQELLHRFSRPASPKQKQVQPPLKGRLDLDRRGAVAVVGVVAALVSGRLRLPPRPRQSLPLRNRRCQESRQTRNRQRHWRKHPSDDPAIHPRDHPIREQRLLRRWRAQGTRLRRWLCNRRLRNRTRLKLCRFPVPARERWCWPSGCRARARVRGLRDTAFIRYRAICCANFFSMTPRSNAFRISFFPICGRC